MFSELAIEGKLILKQDQFSRKEGEAPVALRVFHRAEGWALFLSNWWKYSFLALHWREVTLFLWALKASHDTSSWFVLNILYNLLRRSISSLILFEIQGAGFFLVCTVFSGACRFKTSSRRELKISTLSSGLLNTSSTDHGTVERSSSKLAFEKCLKTYQ